MYGMGVAGVDDRVMEGLKANQEILGRVIWGVSNRVGGECGSWGGCL